VIRLDLNLPPIGNPLREITLFLRALENAADLVVRFRLAGNNVVTEGMHRLPDDDRAVLEEAVRNGLLWAYMGGETSYQRVKR